MQGEIGSARLRIQHWLQKNRLLLGEDFFVFEGLENWLEYSFDKNRQNLWGTTLKTSANHREKTDCRLMVSPLDGRKRITNIDNCFLVQKMPQPCHALLRTPQQPPSSITLSSALLNNILPPSRPPPHSSTTSFLPHALLRTPQQPPSPPSSVLNSLLPQRGKGWPRTPFGFFSVFFQPFSGLFSIFFGFLVSAAACRPPGCRLGPPSPEIQPPAVLVVLRTGRPVGGRWAGRETGGLPFRRPR